MLRYDIKTIKISKSVKGHKACDVDRMVSKKDGYKQKEKPKRRNDIKCLTLQCYYYFSHLIFNHIYVFLSAPLCKLRRLYNRYIYTAITPINEHIHNFICILSSFLHFSFCVFLQPRVSVRPECYPAGTNVRSSNEDHDYTPRICCDGAKFAVLINKWYSAMTIRCVTRWRHHRQAEKKGEDMLTSSRVISITVSTDQWKNIIANTTTTTNAIVTFDAIGT